MSTRSLIPGGKVANVKSDISFSPYKTRNYSTANGGCFSSLLRPNLFNFLENCRSHKLLHTAQRCLLSGYSSFITPSPAHRSRNFSRLSPGPGPGSIPYFLSFPSVCASRARRAVFSSPECAISSNRRAGIFSPSFAPAVLRRAPGDRMAPAIQFLAICCHFLHAIYILFNSIFSLIFFSP